MGGGGRFGWAVELVSRWVLVCAVCAGAVLWRYVAGSVTRKWRENVKIDPSSWRENDTPHSPSVRHPIIIP
jgi:hypothetical protein